MAKASMEKLLSQLKKDGFTQKAIVSDEQMDRLVEVFDSQKGVIATPPDELRYIEGLTELPFGYLTEFKVIPAPGCKSPFWVFRGAAWQSAAGIF